LLQEVLEVLLLLDKQGMYVIFDIQILITPLVSSNFSDNVSYIFK
jgi:hypothetical protein